MHYFKFDRTGKVQLIFPLYVTKINQTKKVDQFLRQNNFKNFKQEGKYIRIKQQTMHKDENPLIVFQEVDNLKLLLGIENDQEDLSKLQFYFGKDNYHQQICIVDPSKLD